MCYSKPIVSFEKDHNDYRNIKICTWNIQSLFSKVVEENTNVKTLLSPVKRILHKQMYIICLTETWANDKNVYDIACKGYKLYFSNRSLKNKNDRKDSGGVAVLVKSELTPLLQKKKSLSDDSIWLKFNKNLIKRSLACQMI